MGFDHSLADEFSRSKVAIGFDINYHRIGLKLKIQPLKQPN